MPYAGGVGFGRGVDGSGGDADTTIRIGWDNWQKIAAGTLDPMTAFMTGKLRIEGEMATAMQLASRLAAHRKG